MSSIPWRRWLHVGMQLGIAPEAFWRLSVVEWRALLSADQEPTLSRHDLTHLMAAFPDQESTID